MKELKFPRFEIEGPSWSVVFYPALNKVGLWPAPGNAEGFKGPIYFKIGSDAEAEKAYAIATKAKDALGGKFLDLWKAFNSAFPAK